MTGHQYISGATPVPGPAAGWGANKGMGEKKELTPADVIYRIATVTAVISLLASVL
jgi:hypothetical protein